MIQIEGKDKLIFVGDIHGHFDTLRYMISERYKHENAAIIQVGDFGVGFAKPNYYKEIFKQLNDSLKWDNNHLYAIRGNHDNPAWFKETNNPFEYSNITLLADYSEVDFLGRKILCVGGATSVDRIDRQQNYYERLQKRHGHAQQTWWSDEKIKILSPEEFAYKKYDIVVTHTRPSVSGFYKGSGYIGKLILQDPPLKAELIHEAAEMTRLWEYTKPELWVYGHFHEPMVSRHEGTIFRCLTIDEHKLYDK